MSGLADARSTTPVASCGRAESVCSRRGAKDECRRSHREGKLNGELPRELRGLYVRNSPNPQFAPIGKYHWFDGDGMVHGIRLEDGRASYMNRWVRTCGFEAEREAGKALWTGILEPLRPEAMSLPGGPVKDTANTDLVFHRGRLLSLWWLSGTPYELSTRDLSTIGPERFGGKLTGGPARISSCSSITPWFGAHIFGMASSRPRGSDLHPC